MRMCRFTVSRLLLALALPPATLSGRVQGPVGGDVDPMRLCGPRSQPQDARVLAGVVRNAATSSPHPQAQVILTWPRASEAGVVEVRETVASNDEGRYAICDVPLVERAVVRAISDGLVSEFVTLTLGSGPTLSTPGTWRQDLVLAPADTRMVSLSGTITDATSEGGVSGATVELWGTNHIATTDSGGGFRMNRVWAGDHRLVVRRIGYAQAVFDLAIPSGADAAIPVGQLAVRTVPERLRPVIVAATPGSRRLDDFYRRRQRGFGDFITRDDFAQFNPTAPSDVLRRIPGIAVRPNPNYGLNGDARAFIIESRRALVREGEPAAIDDPRRTGSVDANLLNRLVSRVPECPVIFFIDGAFMGTTRDNEIDLALDAFDIAAVESYFGGQIPAAFNAPGAACGVVAFWTR